MTVIRKVIKAVRDGTLVVDPSVVRSLRVFIGNRNGRHKGEDIEHILHALIKQEWPLTPEFNAESIKWMQGILLRKDGDVRDTPEGRKFGALEREVIRNLSGFYLTGYWANLEDYWLRTDPDHPRRTNVYPIYRAVDLCGMGFEFMYVPWQNDTDRTKTGFKIFGTGAYQK